MSPVWFFHYHKMYSFLKYLLNNNKITFHKQIVHLQKFLAKLKITLYKIQFNKFESTAPCICFCTPA